jgi:hypothetical protein
MENTGYQGWTTLEEYFIDNGLATGNCKNNLSSDPNYVAPLWDTGACPIANYIIDISVSQIDFSEQGGGGDYLANITSNYDSLDLVCSDVWFQVYPSNMSGGTAGGDLFVLCDGSTYERQGSIDIFYSGTQIGSIRIFQTGY